MRLTVLGSGTAQPQADTPASGLLLESSGSTVLLDCGSGTASRLRTILDPTTLSALIVGHLHADHYIDLAPLRYLFPWAGGTDRPLPVHIPPGGRPRIDALAVAISERAGFFDDTFTIAEYDPAAGLTVGDLDVAFCRARHYVPAWSIAVTDPSGARIVYVGDTGPSDDVVAFAAGADLVILESTLRSADDDDVERGHLTPEEAIDMCIRTNAARGLIVHYASARRAEIRALCDAAAIEIEPGEPGLTIDVAGRAAETRRAAAG